MNRRVIGRGRLITGLGALLVLVGCFPAWFTVGGGPGELTAISHNAFDGAGIVVFVAAVAALALIALPFAAGDQPLAIDRAAAFLIVAAIGLVGFFARLVQLTLDLHLGEVGLGPITPDRAPGLWLAGAGLLVLFWGAMETRRERGRL